jgi:hypothetical protein
VPQPTTLPLAPPEQSTEKTILKYERERERERGGGRKLHNEKLLNLYPLSVLLGWDD